MSDETLEPNYTVAAPNMGLPVIFTLKHEIDTAKLRNTLLILAAVLFSGKILILLLAKLLK